MDRKPCAAHFHAACARLPWLSRLTTYGWGSPGAGKTGAATEESRQCYRWVLGWQRGSPHQCTRGWILQGASETGIRSACRETEVGTRCHAGDGTVGGTTALPGL